jgi:hypothetical protein
MRVLGVLVLDKLVSNLLRGKLLSALLMCGAGSAMLRGMLSLTNLQTDK